MISDYQSTNRFWFIKTQGQLWLFASDFAFLYFVRGSPANLEKRSRLKGKKWNWGFLRGNYLCTRMRTLLSSPSLCRKEWSVRSDGLIDPRQAKSQVSYPTNQMVTFDGCCWVNSQIRWALGDCTPINGNCKAERQHDLDQHETDGVIHDSSFGLHGSGVAPPNSFLVKLLIFQDMLPTKEMILIPPFIIIPPICMDSVRKIN